MAKDKKEGRGRTIKICALEKKNPKAYNLINEVIKNGGNRAEVARQVNQEFKLKILRINITHHAPHVIPPEVEIEPQLLRRDSGKNTEQNQTKNISQIKLPRFPRLSAKYERFIFLYQKEGYKNAEKCFAAVGCPATKEVYSVLEKSEVKAAINELRAIDLIDLKDSPNQLFADLMKVASWNKYNKEMFLEDSCVNANFQDWPEELF